MIAPLVLEGTWEEIAARADEFRGCHLRVEVLSPVLADQQEPAADRAPDSATLDAGDEPDGYPVDPFFVTDECSLPFDLPRPGEPDLVPYIDGADRLPEVPPEWRDKERDSV
jgi:hypothetical protein